MPVVDASVVVEFIKPEIGSSGVVEDLFGRWARDGVTLAAPRLMWEEALNALLTGVRRTRWTGEQADVAATLLGRLPVTAVADERDRARAFELARRYDNWPVYDMVYVAVAERLAEPLVTADERLRSRLAHLGWVLGPEDVVDHSPAAS
jgi:predicted nucleic acid-binding protein